MRILCISDEKDSLIYSNNIKERYKDIDFVISAGDLPLRYYEFIISSLNKDLYFVFGNHNLRQLHVYKKKSLLGEIDKSMYYASKPWIYGGICLEDKVVYDKKHNLLFLGFGGSFVYNKGMHQFSERQMFFRILRKIPRLLYNKIRYKRYLDILVTHASPLNIHDGDDLCHRGFNVFNWFIKKFKPKYLLHGHMHLIDMNKRPITKIGETTVINIFKNYILEIDNG